MEFYVFIQGGNGMNNFYGINSNSVSTLFSSLSANKNSGFSTNNILSDYYSIRNGSYKKLLNAYYDKYGKDSSGVNHNNSISVSADSASRLTSIKSSSSKLQDAAAKLLNRGSDSVFKQTEVKDEKGNVTKEYDMDKIYSAVKNFADSYNDTIKAGSESKSKAISKATDSMISTTVANQKLLKSVGISIDENNGSLSVDKEKLKNSNVSAIKSLFNDAGSYGYYMTTKSSEINAAAVLEASKANTYTSAGSYPSSISSGDLYDSIF